MHCIKYSKSLVESGGVLMIKNGGLSVLQRGGFVPCLERRLVVSSDHVGGGGVSSGVVSMVGSRRFFNTGGGIIATTTESSSSSLVIRDIMFYQAGNIPNLFRGRQTGGCNKSHMLPYFARRALASSSSASQSKKRREYPKLQRRERCDKISSSSSKVSLNQFPGLMVHGIIKNSKTRRLLRLNPDNGYFEEQDDDDVAAGGGNRRHGHYYDLLQVPNGHVCRGSAYGWLFLTDDNLDMKLLNPFSGAEIQLPPVKTLPPSSNEEERWDLSKWFVAKAVFSANPSIEPRPVVLIIYGGQHVPRLAFCKPGDQVWTPLEFPVYSWHMDVIFHKGQFYVLGWPGYVATFDIGRRLDDDDHSVKTDIVATPKRKPYMRDWYLVVLDGELVRFELRSACFHDCCIDETTRLLVRLRNRDGDTTDQDCSIVEDYTDEESDDDDDDGNSDKESDDDDDDGNSDKESDDDDDDGNSDNESDDDDDGNTNEESDDDDGKKATMYGPYVDDQRLPARTYGVKIRRFDASEKQWVKVESLGDKAVFLGYNTSFALSASDYPGGLCIPDSVYFTYGGGGNEGTERFFYDMGIYNVKDKTVKPIYPPMNDEVEDFSHFLKPAPIWIVNSAS